MSLVAYADSDEDSSDSESAEPVSLPVAGQQRVASVSNEDVGDPVHFPGPAVLGP